MSLIILYILSSFNDPAIFITIDSTKEEIFAEAKIEGLFTPQIIEGINKGFTASIEYIIDLMEDRRLWIDQLIERKRIAFFIDYDLWNKEYRIKNIYNKTERFKDLETILNQVCIQKDLYICPRNMLDTKKSYYVLIRVELKPLIIRNLNNIVNYIKGETKESKRDKFFMHILRLVKNLAGLEDRVVIGKSDSFNP